MQAKNQYYTREEVAKLLNVHPITVYRWIKDGKLPVLRLGHRTVRIPVPAVKHLIATGQFPGNGQQRAQ